MGVPGDREGAVTSTAKDVDPEVGIIYRPQRAFDHGLPDVPPHAFIDELALVCDSLRPSGEVYLDLSGLLRLPYPATTPVFLAWYTLIRAGDALSKSSGGAVEFH